MFNASIPTDIYYIIPDTSWLLKESFKSYVLYNSIHQEQLLPMPLRIASLPLRIPFKMLKNWVDSNVGGDNLLKIQPTFILLDEVLNEVAGLHNAKSSAPTGNAKDGIRHIMDTYHYLRMSTKDSPEINLEEGNLGIDSKVDHGIISTAVSVASNTEITQVLVLTHDSGIKLELSSQKRKHAYRVYSSLDDLKGSKLDSKIAKYLAEKYRIGRIIT